MLTRIHLNLVSCLLLLSVLPVHLACQAKKTDRTTMIMEDIRRSSVPIVFYGDVCDDKGLPVVGAEVTVQIRYFTPNPAAFFEAVRELSIRTGDNGDFTFKGISGSLLLVTDIKKTGYDWAPFREDTERSYHYSPEKKYSYIPNSKIPVVFHMRKKGEEAFLFKGNGRFSFDGKDSGTEQALDVINHEDIKGEELKTLQVGGVPLVPDLKSKATWNPKTSTWTVVLSAGTPGGGLLVLDRLLYEAPAEGYKDSFTFQVRVPRVSRDPRDPQQLPLVILPGTPAREIQLTQDAPTPPQQTMHIYLRSRQPAIYSRLLFDYPWARPDRIDFGGSIETNPYGDRNLEEATDLPAEIRISLGNEVRDSFLLGKRPPKPDYSKLVSDSEKSRPLTERLKDVFRR